MHTINKLYSYLLYPYNLTSYSGYKRKVSSVYPSTKMYTLIKYLVKPTLDIADKINTAETIIQICKLSNLWDTLVSLDSCNTYNAITLDPVITKPAALPDALPKILLDILDTDIAEQIIDIEDILIVIPCVCLQLLRYAETLEE